MKVRINLNIDVLKLDKGRFFTGDKGTYCDITTVIDLDNPDQYGNHGFITQSKNKDEPKDLQLPILGNAKIVWKEGQEQVQQQGMQQAQQAVNSNGGGSFDDDIPFNRLGREHIV